MIRNYLKTALRVLKGHKGFTAINMLGLSVGLATCLLIVLYVVDESGYDRFNVKADRIYRINCRVKFGGNDFTYAAAAAPAAAEVKKGFPEVENCVRLAQGAIWRPEGLHVKKGNETIEENKFAFVDPGWFSVFTLPMVEGDPVTALEEPNTIVITESTARKYFGRTDVVGRTLTFNDTSNMRVTGVIRDIPRQSHYHFDIFISMATMPEGRETSWLGGGFNTYLLLKPGADPKRVQKEVSDLTRKKEGQPFGGIDAFEKNGNRFLVDLSPLRSIHLDSNRQQEMEANGSRQAVWIFSAIALLILLIACVNFMNLSTARSANRAREVGVRKVLGSGRAGLIIQFLMESVTITLASTVIALLLIFFLLPFFNQLSGKELAITAGTLAWLLPASLGLVLVVGVFTGFYPAFVLSSFQPIAVLKGRFTQGSGGVNFRDFLVVFQFAISIFLIVGTLVIYTQMRYIQQKDLGYSREHVLVIKDVTPLGERAKVLKEALLRVNGVEDATLTNFLPTAEKRDGTSLAPVPYFDQKLAVLVEFWPVDADYIPTLGMKIIAGRNFSSQMPTDSSAVILNETAARIFGFDNPLNKSLYRFSYGRQEYHVIGIMKDFNFNSLRQNVTPLALTLGNNLGALSLRVRTANLPGLIGEIKDRWKDIAPNQQFGYSFMDADFEAEYRGEERTGSILLVFTVLAISIACLGIFGLAAYSAERRSKEIGIRKILGASVPGIVGMLSGDFVRLVGIAILIASPLAWWAMQRWLQGFAYRTSLQWWMVAVGGCSAVLIALLTVSIHTVRAAKANPVKNLRMD